MALSIDSEALLTLKRTLNMPGAGSSETVLEDGSVTQTLDILAIARRSLTPVESGGLFAGVLENVHGAADNERNTVDPYNPTFPLRGYPGPVPVGFDVWVLNMSVLRISGAGDLVHGQLRYESAAFAVGFAQDDAAGFITASNMINLADFGAINAFGGGISAAAEIGTGKLNARIGMRVRRGLSLVFDTTSDGIATFRAVIMMGVFPEGLGQDGIL